MSSPHRAMLGIIGGTGMAEALGSLGSGEQTRVDTPFGPPSSPIRVVEIGGAPVALLPRHGEGHRFQPSAGSLPGQRLRPEGGGRHPRPRHGGGRLAPGGDPPRRAGGPGPGHRSHLPPDAHLLRRARGPRRVRPAVLQRAPEGPARGAGGGPGARRRHLRLHGGSAVLDPGGERSPPLLGRAPHRHDPDARGQARPRGRALLRGGEPGHRLRLLAPAPGGPGRAGAARGDHREPAHDQRRGARARSRGAAGHPVAGGLGLRMPGLARRRHLHLGTQIHEDTRKELDVLLRRALGSR